MSQRGFKLRKQIEDEDAFARSNFTESLCYFEEEGRPQLFSCLNIKEKARSIVVHS